MLIAKQGGIKYHFLKGVGMTRPGIEPRSPGPLVNSLPTGPISPLSVVLSCLFISTIFFISACISIYLVYYVCISLYVVCHVCESRYQSCFPLQSIIIFLIHVFYLSSDLVSHISVSPYLSYLLILCIYFIIFVFLSISFASISIWFV